VHEIAQNCICNAQKSLAAGAYDAPPNLLVGWGGVNQTPCAQTSPLNAFGISLRLRRLKSNPMCPSQNNFLDPPLTLCLGINVLITHNKQNNNYKIYRANRSTSNCQLRLLFWRMLVIHSWIRRFRSSADSSWDSVRGCLLKGSVWELSR